MRLLESAARKRISDRARPSRHWAHSRGPPWRQACCWRHATCPDGGASRDAAPVPRHVRPPVPRGGVSRRLLAAAKKVYTDSERRFCSFSESVLTCLLVSGSPRLRLLGPVGSARAAGAGTIPAAGSEARRSARRRGASPHRGRAAGARTRPEPRRADDAAARRVQSRSPDRVYFCCSQRQLRSPAVRASARAGLHRHAGKVIARCTSAQAPAARARTSSNSCFQLRPSARRTAQSPLLLPPATIFCSGSKVVIAPVGILSGCGSP